MLKQFGRAKRKTGILFLQVVSMSNLSSRYCLFPSTDCKLYISNYTSLFVYCYFYPLPWQATRVCTTTIIHVITCIQIHGLYS